MEPGSGAGRLLHAHARRRPSGAASPGSGIPMLHTWQRTRTQAQCVCAQQRCMASFGSLAAAGPQRLRTAPVWMASGICMLLPCPGTHATQNQAAKHLVHCRQWRRTDRHGTPCAPLRSCSCSSALPCPLHAGCLQTVSLPLTTSRMQVCAGQQLWGAEQPRPSCPSGCTTGVPATCGPDALSTCLRCCRPGLLQIPPVNLKKPTDAASHRPPVSSSAEWLWHGQSVRSSSARSFPHCHEFYGKSAPHLNS